MTRWRMAVAVAVGAAAALVTPTAASAAAGPDVARALSEGQYCAVWGPTQETICADTPEALTVERESSFGVAQRSSGVAAANQFVLGTFYTNASFGGSWIQFWGPAACTASATDINGGWADTTTWRSLITSFQGASNCRIKIWYFANYTGSTNGAFQASNGNVDALNDHVWSARFT